MTEKIYVIGHKNPDTDSICSAIAYANFKNIIENTDRYVPKRAGHTNLETKFVLKQFGFSKPGLVDTLEPRAKNVHMRKTKGIDAEDSLMNAWAQMKREKLWTLPVYQDGKFCGMVTQGDITRSLMEDAGDMALSSSYVSCKNILNTINGTLLVGDESAVFKEGNVTIAASAPEVLKMSVKKHSMVIIGNRSDAQITALEQGAEWMIVSSGSEVLEVIKKLAESVHCNIISTPYSAYQTIRLINQSMPVRHVMYTGELVKFLNTDFVKDVKRVIMKHRIRYFPVFSKNGNIEGLISQRNILDMKRRQVILVDHNEKSQAVNDIDAGEVVEIVDHHRIGGLQTPNPVFFRNQPLGSTCTIIAGLYREYGVEISKEIAGIMCAAILSDTLCFRSPTCTEVDKSRAMELAEIAGIQVEEFAMEMFKAGSRFESRSEEEIFYSDFKSFSVDSYHIGVSQVSFVGEEAAEMLESRMEGFIQNIHSRIHLDMVCIVLTDIMESSSKMLYVGDPKALDVDEVVSTAFQREGKNGKIWLPGIVSRKKQIVPMLTIAIQNM